VDAIPDPQVEIRRSARRRRTGSAYREGDRIVVLVPQRLSRAAEAELVETLVARIVARERRRGDDAELFERAVRLARRHLGAHLPAAHVPLPSSVRWVDTMQSRWGSCTPADGTIRLSERLQTMPDYVVDYVLTHELAHLVVAEHSERFWQLLTTVPHLERARGFLDGYAAAGRHGKGWHGKGEPDGSADADGTAATDGSAEARGADGAAGTAGGDRTPG